MKKNRKMFNYRDMVVDFYVISLPDDGNKKEFREYFNLWMNSDNKTQERLVISFLDGFDSPEICK